MKNMNNKTKKWLTVAGGLAMCAVLVVLIGTQFQKDTVKDDPLPTQSSQPSDVTVETPSAEKEVVVTPPEIPTETPNTNNGAVSSGTEQTIQADPVKPEYTEEQLKDDTKTPDGKPVTTPPPAVDHDKVDPPKDQPKPESKPENKPSGGNSIPGFDNVPNLGENQAIEGESDGDINKQVGTMD